MLEYSFVSAPAISDGRSWAQNNVILWQPINNDFINGKIKAVLNEFAMQERANVWEILPSLKNYIFATLKF